MQPWWRSEGVQGSSAEAASGRCCPGGATPTLRPHGCPPAEWRVQSSYVVSMCMPRMKFEPPSAEARLRGRTSDIERHVIVWLQ